MKSSPKSPACAYHLNQDGCFCIENYHQAKPFSNFFPGVAGEWGIPMWVFYVNRGQGVSSFGIESKDKAILEFQPANKSYRLAATHGFRTFIKVHSGKKTIFWEPFANAGASAAFRSHQTMYITAHDMTIVDENFTLGLKVTVNYFTLAGESFPSLIRRVRLENTTRRPLKLELLDGLPAINAFGIKDWLSKNMTRTVEAWVKVSNVSARAPFYHLNVEVADTPDVRPIEEGFFHFGFEAGRSKLLEPVVATEPIFGQATDFQTPQAFLEKNKFTVPKIQQTSNRTPCAFSFHQAVIPGRGVEEIIQAYGYAHNQNALNDIVTKMTRKDFINEKARLNKYEIDRIKNFALTSSAVPEFNLYCGQTFLDNVLRGGLPVSLPTGEGPVAFNVYSRKHGDLERDYNYFTLAPTYFSQGNGNYRDVNQNRRNDIWFNRDVGDTAIVNFLSLIQADGYNPLVVKGLSFVIESDEKIKAILRLCVQGDSQILRAKLANGFQPGELVQIVDQKKIPLKVSQREFLSRVLGDARKNEQADHGEGFWIDHWTYNLDLIESYLGRYPEHLKALLLERKDFSFYHNTHYVLPHERRYMMTDKGVRQYKSVFDGIKELEKDRNGHKLCTGNGKVYYTSLLAKLLCLTVNKAATLDPDGLGIEMEADKPGWYDALNGLPGLLGSSICETFELRRLSLFLLDSLNRLNLKDDGHIPVFEELATFIEELVEVLRYEEEPLAYWDKANEVKEFYRSRVVAKIEGREREVSIGKVRELLKLVVLRTDRALAARTTSKGVVPTYFYYEITDYEKLDMDPYVMPKKFKRHTLPLFLEGPVHAMRSMTDAGMVSDLHRAVRQSPLFDRKLKMYKVNADLSGQVNEIGRTRIFPKGWLENESIWLHMEYKYILELLRAGLYEEFFESFEQVLIPFLKPQVYGRSVLENSSFIVSSAHEDSSLHGQGFVARLSGSTAEFIHMWLLMNAGRRPFMIEKGKLSLALKPALPGWLFTKQASLIQYLDREGLVVDITLPKNTYAFNFLGSTLVIYHNPGRKNTYGSKPAKIARIILTSPEYTEPVMIDGAVVPELYARDIRDCKVDRIDVYLV